MRSDKLQDAVGMVDESLAHRAEQKPKKTKKFLKWTAPIAAVLVLALAVGIIFGNSDLVFASYVIEKAENPKRAGYPGVIAQMEGKGDWYEERKERREYQSAAKPIGDFAGKTMYEILSGTNGENLMYSPLNVYLALAMLAETAGGETRDQLLSLLGEETIEALRTQANNVWFASYSNDGAYTSIPATSIWLDKDISYKQDTLVTLAEQYHASSFSGEMGSAGYNKALQAWLNENTGNMLTDLTRELEMDPMTVMTIAATFFFEAKWEDKFEKANNTEDVFHGASGDQRVTFMNETNWNGRYYWGEQFSATSKSLEGGADMFFILPDEGVSMDALLQDDELSTLLSDVYGYENSTSLRVNLSVPKFDVMSETDLADALKNLGVTDAFSLSASDFTNLTEDTDVFVSEVKHGVRVKMDEEGVAATSYVIIPMAGSGAPPEDEIDFVVDRPFIFFIRGEYGEPLFMGVVNIIQ